mmetsp:Transcript_451/g.1257  ORF Transcript_451/g.1257 Transcript_451/m.1257 type:complete len:153 (-) Transcript_451:77-535(-)
MAAVLLRAGFALLLRRILSSSGRRRVEQRGVEWSNFGGRRSIRTKKRKKNQVADVSNHDGRDKSINQSSASVPLPTHVPCSDDVEKSGDPSAPPPMAGCQPTAKERRWNFRRSATAESEKKKQHINDDNASAASACTTTRTGRSGSTTNWMS